MPASRKVQEDILEEFLNEVIEWRNKHERMISIFRSMGDEFSDKEAALAELSADSYAWVLFSALEAGKTIDSPRDVLRAVNDGLDKQVEKVLTVDLYPSFEVNSHYGYVRHQISEEIRKMDNG